MAVGDLITRAQLSEDKGKIRPFDIFVTINQTRDEAKDEIMRLHTDKLRDYKNGNPIATLIKVWQNELTEGSFFYFYDGTLHLFSDIFSLVLSSIPSGIKSAIETHGKVPCSQNCSFFL